MDLEFGAALGAGAALARVFAFDLGAISQESVGLSYTCWTVLDKLQRMSPLNQQKYNENHARSVGECCVPIHLS